MLNKKICCMAGAVALWGLASCGDAQVVVPGNLGIVSIQPSQGAVDISFKEFSVAFSAGIPKMAEADVNKYFELSPLDHPAEKVKLSATFQQNDGEDSNGQPCSKFVMLKTSDEMRAGERYVLTVNKGIVSCNEDIGELPTSVSIQFKTALTIND